MPHLVWSGSLASRLLVCGRRRAASSARAASAARRSAFLSPLLLSRGAHEAVGNAHSPADVVRGMRGRHRGRDRTEPLALHVPAASTRAAARALTGQPRGH